ncbi:MAG: hypothetical protein K2M10_03485 [Muribaculaceae bacterium]|nr:hypothetical protein [Muribaculaceae bacterium]
MAWPRPACAPQCASRSLEPKAYTLNSPLSTLHPPPSTLNSSVYGA